jgi:catechol-2,3-dioxygenase
MVQLVIETFQKNCIASNQWPSHTLSPNKSAATVSAVEFMTRNRKKKRKKKKKKERKEVLPSSSISGFALASQMCQIFPLSIAPFAFIFVL